MNWVHFFSWLIVAGLLSAAHAQPAPPLPQQPLVAVPQPAPAPPAATTPPAAPLPPLSADYQSGFCAGWNAASGVEQQRYGNWRALIQLGQPAPDSPASVAVGSVQLYVLIQPLPGGTSLNLTDGRTVACPAEAKK